MSTPAPSAAPDTDRARPGQNWAGNHSYLAGTFRRPRTVEEVQQIVASSSRVRALGTRHSFNALCDSEGTLLDVTTVEGGLEIDPDRRVVRVPAGTTYGALAAHVQGAGWALANMASLPHISVGGSVATGTHGSGVANRILGSSVSSLRVVTADGSLRTVRRGEAGFDGAVVSLGVLGVVVDLELDLEPTFDVLQESYDHLRWSDVLDDLDRVLASAYSVSVFTHWTDEQPTEVLSKARIDQETAGLPGAVPLGAAIASPTLGGPDHLTVRGEPGPWSDRLPHFRADQTPSMGEEIQTEWFVPADCAVDALRAATRLAPRVADLLLVTEIRTLAADELWLSPAQGRDTVAIHFTWRRDPSGVLGLAREIQAVLAPFSARAHWGKVFDVEALDAARLYPRLDDFDDLRAEWDPRGVFRSDLVDQMLGRATRR